MRLHAIANVVAHGFAQDEDAAIAQLGVQRPANTQEQMARISPSVWARAPPSRSSRPACARMACASFPGRGRRVMGASKRWWGGRPGRESC